MLANFGYVGFALDMYGKGILGASKEENAALKRPFINDRQLLQKRVLSGFEAARSLPYVDPEQIVAIGFGFGGLCALDLARSGARLKGAISIYGHLDPPPDSLMKKIQAKILILHGYKDPLISQNELKTFEKEMDAACVDWQLHIFGQAMHAFATPSANDPAAGLLYDPVADHRAWILIRHFLDEQFNPP